MTGKEKKVLEYLKKAGPTGSSFLEIQSNLKLDVAKLGDALASLRLQNQVSNSKDDKGMEIWYVMPFGGGNAAKQSASQPKMAAVGASGTSSGAWGPRDSGLISRSLPPNPPMPPKPASNPNGPYRNPMSSQQPATFGNGPMRGAVPQGISNVDPFGATQQIPVPTASSRPQVAPDRSTPSLQGRGAIQGSDFNSLNRAPAPSPTGGMTAISHASLVPESQGVSFSALMFFLILAVAISVGAGWFLSQTSVESAKKDMVDKTGYLAMTDGFRNFNNIAQKKIVTLEGKVEVLEAKIDSLSNLLSKAEASPSRRGRR